MLRESAEVCQGRIAILSGPKTSHSVYEYSRCPILIYVAATNPHDVAGLLDGVYHDPSQVTAAAVCALQP